MGLLHPPLTNMHVENLLQEVGEPSGTDGGVEGRNQKSHWTRGVLLALDITGSHPLFSRLIPCNLETFKQFGFAYFTEVLLTLLYNGLQSLSIGHWWLHHHIDDSEEITLRANWLARAILQKTNLFLQQSVPLSQIASHILRKYLNLNNVFLAQIVFTS